MKGEFIKKKFSFPLFLFFLCGLFFIGLYVYAKISDPDAESVILIFLITGILICLAAAALRFLNYGAYITVDEDSIKAKYGWFSKIDCKLSDVIFAEAQIKTLTIQLKNGKTHSVLGLANPCPLASVIKRKMAFEESGSPDTLLEKLNGMKKARKKYLILTFACIALMFIFIFVTVFLTGGKDLNGFSKTDWIIFAIFMGAGELITVIAAFYFARKTGIKNVPIERMQYAIRRRTIETEALFPGNVVGVYTNEDYACRYTVLRFPNDSSVYCIVEGYKPDCSLVKEFESEIFESADQLPDAFDSLIDISDMFLH